MADTLNMKNLPFTQKGAGLAYSGLTPDTLYSQLPTIYAQRGQEQGGMKELWNSLNTYAGKNPNAGFSKYLQTGQTGPGFDKQYAANAYDYAIREAARAQQHKDPGFLSSLFTDILPEVALGAIPGVGPELAAAYGGIKGGLDSGNFLGGLTGALSGYGAGSFGGGLGSEFSAAGGLGELTSNPMEFLKTLGYNVGGDITSGLSNIGNAITGLPGEISNLFGGSAGTAAPITEAGISASTGLPVGGLPNVAAGGAGVPDVTGLGVGQGATDAGAAVGGDATGAAGLASQPGVNLTSIGNAANQFLPQVPGGVTSAAAPTSTTPSAPAPGFMDKAMNLLTKNPMQTAMLGLTGAQALMGPQTSSAEKLLGRQAAPYNAEAKQLMEFYNSGQLHPADEQEISQFAQQEAAKIHQYWANAGAPNSTGKIQMLNDLEKRVTAMRDQTRQSYLASALQAGGLGNQATSTLAQLKQLGDNQASAALNNLMQQFALSQAYGRNTA